MAATLMRKNRLKEMESAIHTLLGRGVTLEEIKAGSLEALVGLVKKKSAF
jgi:hypothetical protein